MKVIILGAGQVGTSLATSLVHEEHDVTMVDKNESLLRELRERLDIRTQAGSASFPHVLESAGINDCDMLIAVTGSDEINMVACQVAATLYRTPERLARIRSSAYLARQAKLFHNKAIPISGIISPEALVTQHIFRLISHPGTLQVLDFANGELQLIVVKAYYDGPLVGKALREFKNHIPDVAARVVAIFRQNRAIIPDGETVIEADDEVFILATPKHIRTIISELRKLDKPYKQIMIAGGGSIGKRLAQQLEASRYHIKILEHDAQRAAYLAENLDKTIILEGDAANETLLIEENIDKVDVFLALTNDDEANIISAMLAKRLRAKRVISLINRYSYVDLVEDVGAIDIAVSPQQITMGALLAKIRSGDIVAVHSLRRGAAEAIEVIAHGDLKTSRVIGRAIKDINLPPSSIIGAIIRNNNKTKQKRQVIMASSQVIIEENDHIFIFLADKRYIPTIEKLFQVSVGFLGGWRA
ncbi:MAG: Trk system potassium transporter TrkA [bacterium]